MEKNTVTKTGMGFIDLLQIAFIVLKLCKVITWSWWIVLIPLFAQFAILLILGIVLAISN